MLSVESDAESFTLYQQQYYEQKMEEEKKRSGGPSRVRTKDPSYVKAFSNIPITIVGGGARRFNSDPSLMVDWQQFYNFLLQRMTAKTAEDRLRYAKQFYSLLLNGDAHSLLSVPPNKRIHIMKALSSLARFTGQQDLWLTYVSAMV
jgi:hypothetical protein